MSTCPRPHRLRSPDGNTCSSSRPPIEYARRPPPAVTTTARWSPETISTSPSARRARARAPASGEALEHTVAHPERVRHCRQRGVDGADAGEDARVGDVEVVDLM